MDTNPDQGSTPPLEPLSAGSARALLGRLRDLNMTAERVRLCGGDSVTVEGCLSMDEPVSGGLIYLLRGPEGDRRRLDISWSGGALSLAVASWPCGAIERERVLPLLELDGRWAAALEVRARVDIQAPDGRQLNHFLRRLVRGVYAA